MLRSTPEAVAAAGAAEGGVDAAVRSHYPHPAMTTDDAISDALAELSAIAKAPMTPEQREQRSQALIAGEITVEAIARATARADLRWSTEMAKVHEIDVAMWLEAVKTVGLADRDSLMRLLDGLHAAESAADLLRSGYRPERGASGELSWSRA